jgi:outer membrane protein assembly factor BamB
MYRTSGEPPPLVIATIADIVTALDRRTGERVWTVALKAHRMVVADDCVVVVSLEPKSLLGVDCVPVVTGLDFATGARRWQLKLSAGVSLDVTVMIERDQILVAAMGMLTAISFVDGSVQWHQALLGDSGQHRPVALAVPGRSQQADR